MMQKKFFIFPFFFSITFATFTTSLCNCSKITNNIKIIGSKIQVVDNVGNAYYQFLLPSKPISNISVVLNGTNTNVCIPQSVVANNSTFTLPVSIINRNSSGEAKFNLDFTYFDNQYKTINTTITDIVVIYEADESYDHLGYVIDGDTKHFFDSFIDSNICSNSNDKIIFLDGCEFERDIFNLPIYFSSNTQYIDDNFLYGCKSFNKPINFVASIATIGKNFLFGCSSFDQTLEIPWNINLIKSGFMFNCYQMSSAIIVDCQANVFNQSLTTLSCDNVDCPMYDGVLITGWYKNDFLNYFKPLFLPNESIYRRFKNSYSLK